jgi:hypothetical protein
LGFEVHRTSDGIALFQKKYTVDLLQAHGYLGCKPVQTPLDWKQKFSIGDSIFFFFFVILSFTEALLANFFISLILDQTFLLLSNNLVSF